MEDKQFFQQMAQCLIDYDVSMSKEYQQSEYYWCPKWFPLHRIFLIFVVVVNILFWVLCNVKPRANTFNLLFVVIWSALYAYHRTQVLKKKRVLRRRKNMVQSQDRQKYIEILDVLWERNPQWGIEPWWKEITGMQLPGYDMNYFAFPFVQTDQNNDKYLVDKDSYNRVSGEKVKKLSDAGRYQHFVIRKESYHDSEKYGIAALCVYTVNRSTKTLTMPKYGTYEEINEQMDAYTEKLV